MPLSPLFRPEAMAHLRRTGLVQPGGLIRLASPWSPLMGAGALVLLVGLGMLLGRGEYSRRIPLQGELMPVGGYLEVKSQAAGWVSKWAVAEGQTVRAGQVLATIRTERSVAQGDVADLQLQALQRRRQSLDQSQEVQQTQVAQRLEQLSQRIQSLDAEWQSVQVDRAAMHQRSALHEQAEHRDRSLMDSGFLAPAHLHSRREEGLELQLRNGQLQRQLAALQRERQTLEAEALQVRTQHRRQLLDLQAEGARLEQEEAEWRARRGLVLRAPQDARVVMRAREEGQSVQPGHTLVGLVPLADEGARLHEEAPAAFQAVLWAPSHAVAHLSPGLEVWLRGSAVSPVRHGMIRGRVVEVGEVPMPGTSWQAASDGGPGTGWGAAYRVAVTLADGHRSSTGQPLSLKAGMSVQADILREPRALWEWWFEPLLWRWRQWGLNPEVQSAGAQARRSGSDGMRSQTPSDGLLGG